MARRASCASEWAGAGVEVNKANTYKMVVGIAVLECCLERKICGTVVWPSS
jgi:hypothetical protein